MGLLEGSDRLGDVSGISTQYTTVPVVWKSIRSWKIGKSTPMSQR